MSKLSDILDAIDPQTVARKIILPCKMAEQTYRTKHLVPQSYEEFLEDCAGYWNHLHKCYYQMSECNMSQHYAGGMALKYIDEAFQKQGGTRWAYEKAKSGMTFGIAKSGITEAFVNEAVSTYTGYTLRSKIDPYNYNEIAALMKEYVQRFCERPVSQGDFQMMIANYSMVLRSHVQHHADMAFERQTGIRA